MAGVVDGLSCRPVVIVCRGWHCDRYTRCALWDGNVPPSPGWRKVLDHYPAGELCEHFTEYAQPARDDG